MKLRNADGHAKRFFKEVWTISRARMMEKVKGQIVDGVIHVFGEKVGFGNGQGQKDKEGGSKGVQMIVRRTMSERGGTG